MSQTVQRFRIGGGGQFIKADETPRSDDVVFYSDYVELQVRCADAEAENAKLKQSVEFARRVAADAIDAIVGDSHDAG
jgi:hypothetical protein